MNLCPVGEPNPHYMCKFCRVWLHRGDSDCSCSALRVDVTAYNSLCVPCAEAVDLLTADTVLGRVHRRLVHDASFTFAHGDD